MKRTRYISLFMALLSVLSITAQQQQSQYALYNYRNDGDFNAWLNIDIDSITYSNISIDSIEYDNIVTQEVWTPDSCYRIPIEAIDSIGFRAPETKYKEETFFLNEEHEPYIRSIDDLNITFDNATPGHLLPSVGQVIVTETSYGILEDGFAGRATSIRNTEDGIEFVCEEVSLSDIFEQIIYVSKCSSTEGLDPEAYHASSSRRRIFNYGIGIDEVIKIPLDPVVTPKKIDGEDMPCQFNYTPEIDMTCLISVFKNQPAVAKVTFHHSHTFSLEMDYEGDIFKPMSRDWWFNKKDIRIHIPVATVDAVIKPYINFGAFIDCNAKVKFEYKLPLLKFEQTFGVDYSEYRKEDDRLQFFNETEFVHDDPTLSLSLDGALAFGLAMKIGAKLIHERLLNFEATFHVGPEFKGHIDLSTDRIGEDANLYRQLKTTTLDLYGYVSIPKATYKYFGSGVKLAKRGTWKGAKWSNKIEKEEDLLPNEDNPEGIMTDWQIKKWHLLPEFEQPKVSEVTATSANASVRPSRNLLWPVDVGVAFKDYQTGEVIEKNCGEYWGKKHNAESNYIQTFENLTPSSIYKVYPTVKFGGILSSLNIKMDAEPSVDYGVAGKLIVTPSSITIKKGEEAEVTIFGETGNLTTIDDDPSIAKSLNIIYDNRNGRHITLHILGVNEGSTYITVLHRSNANSDIVKVTVIGDTKPVTGITLSETTLTLQEGDTHPLTATIYPEDADNRAVTWSSSDETVATVSNEGLVTAVAKGNCTITCSANDDSGVYAECQVTVSQSGGGLVENGDFSLGNTGFVSEYEFVSETGETLWDEGKYAIGTSPHNYHTLFIDHGDHTTGHGNMLIANGSTNNNKFVWKKSFSVEKGKNYEFSAWFLSVSGDTPLDKNQIEYDIDGVTNVGTYDKTENGWERYFGRYNAPETKTIEIKIRSKCPDAGGNDFAIDDISFCSVSSQIVSYLTCPDDHHPHAIDLGLPSGTKWACCNVGATTPGGYGDYFAWGETRPKDVYNWDTYFDSSFEKYNNNGGLTELLPEDDAAIVNWGATWRMPTISQQQELMDNCYSEWTERNGVNGRLVTGPNGGQIFLPAAGYRWSGELYYAGSSGHDWSSSLSPDYDDIAYGMGFNSGYWGCGYWNYRGYGFSVRPVCVQQ